MDLASLLAGCTKVDPGKLWHSGANESTIVIVNAGSGKVIAAPEMYWLFTMLEYGTGSFPLYILPSSLYASLANFSMVH